MSDDTVIPFKKEGNFTDIRTAIREMQKRLPDASRGMIVLFDDNDEGCMHLIHVCAAKELSFIGADCLYNSFVPSEK